MNHCIPPFKTSLLLLSLGFVPPTAFPQATLKFKGPEINVAKNINTQIKAEALSSQVNTGYNEFGPMPTKDGKRLYFSRQGFPKNIGGADDEDIWYSEFNEETQSWKESVNIGPPLNNESPNFITGIGRTADTLLLANVYRKNGKGTAGVSISVMNGGEWSFPVPVNIEADYNLARRATYDVSHDRKTMVISQHKADTYGNLDLYVTFRNEHRKQQYSGTESINLGDVINTPADETSPWLAYDGRTLYFSSDGHNGYGRMDLFKSVRLDETWTNWSKPENLGDGINSAYDDLAFNFNPKSRYAYFSRSLSIQNSDIFRIDMTHLFLDQETAPSTGLQLIGKPAEIGETKVLINVFPDDQTVLNRDVMPDLQRAADFLKKNPTMEIVVSAHSPKHDHRETSSKLSLLRTNVIINYFIENGVQPNRLFANPFGHDIVMNHHTNGEHPPSYNIASSVELKIQKY